MGSTIGRNNGISGIDGEAQSNPQVDEEIHLSLTYLSGSFFSLDSTAGRGALDCGLRSVCVEKCHFHFGSRVCIV